MSKGKTNKDNSNTIKINSNTIKINSNTINLLNFANVQIFLPFSFARSKKSLTRTFNRQGHIKKTLFLFGSL